MSSKTQIGFLGAFLIFCAYLLYPTLQWYFWTDSSTREIVSLSNDRIYSYTQDKVLESLSSVRSLGIEDPINEEVDFLIPFAKDSLKNKKQSLPKTWTKGDFERAFSSDEDLENLKYQVYQSYMEKKHAKSRIMNLGLDLAGGLSTTLSLDFAKAEIAKGRTLTESEQDEIVRQTMDGLRERIDQFGLTDPQITREPSSNRIFVDIPGDPDLSRVESFLKGNNSLSFHIVLEEPTARVQAFFKENPFTADLPAGFLRQGEGLFVQYNKDRYGFDDRSTAQYFVLSLGEEDSFDGSLVSDSRVGQDGITYRPQVEFSLTPEGAEKFFVLTSNNVGKAMAVVFEGNVRSVARINSGIPGGRVSISSDSFTLAEANELTYVLRSAAFPVEVKIDDWRVVGPSLGLDNIEAGIKALSLGLSTVILFMLFYYKGAGLISVLALLINFFSLLAILSTFGLTLTLTSLAGLVLTMGMAVDSNVIIFERIKEEFKVSKNMRQAVSAGFSRALWTVLDANLTTLIAALFLSSLGTGPVQGFAWTLAWGIVTSLFTAVFVTRLFLDLWLEIFKGKLSIGWGGKHAGN